MALKEISISLGILAGSAGIANSGYGLYQNVIVRPSQNAEYNLSLMAETPLVVETVEVQPLSDMAMRVEVTVKIFKTGDILVESGNHRQYIPFQLSRNMAALDGFLFAALAQDTQLIDGVEYEVKTLRYIETITPLEDHQMQQVRTFADGHVETSIIDMRSNQILKTFTEQKSLTDTQRKAIEASPYRKKIFVPTQ